MKKVRDYEINLGVLVMFETIQALSSTYDCLLPTDVMESTDKLISILVKHLSEYNIADDYDFYDSKFIQRVTFKKIKKVK